MANEKIEELARMGERLMVERRDEETGRMEAQADRREEHWQALHAAAAQVLTKDLVETDRYEGRIPLDFRGRASSPWQLHLRPFGAAELLVRFVCVEQPSGDLAWVLEEDGMSGKHTDKEPDCAFRVRQEYVAHWTGSTWEPQPTFFANVTDLTIAVALCKMQTDGWNRCMAECVRRQAADRAAKPVEKG